MRDPVLPGMYPDPSVCRVGGDYFLACSSFEYFPGVPLFHSTDLRHWRQIGNALRRPEQLRLSSAASSGGIYAPTLRQHAGRYWLATTNVSDLGHLIVNTGHPAGSWSDPVPVALPGIDPDLAWDAAGDCWFSYATSAGIMQARIDPLTGAVLEEPRPLWTGTGLAYPEGPHLYNVDGRWYLLIAEGGTERGHAVSVARGPSPRGPFEGYPGNPVLSNRSTAAPVQNTGHGDLVQAADGDWWMVLLGVRPRGGSPGFHVQGRETFLTPVRWVDGWPIPDPVAPGVPDPAGAGEQGVRERDDFDDPALAPGWVSVRQPPASICSLGTRPGWLTVRATGDSMDGRFPAFLGRRQQHGSCQVRALVDAGQGTGGLAVRLDERHHYEVLAGDGQVRCLARIGPLAQQVGAADCPPGPVLLRLEIEAAPDSFESPGAAPDRIRLGFEAPGSEAPGFEAAGSEAAGGVRLLADLDGRYLSTEVAGGFTGRMIGVYASTGTVAVDWFEYTGTDQSGAT